MTRFGAIFLILISIVATQSTALAQWQRIYLPVTGRTYNVTAVTADANGYVFAGGTEEGIPMLFKSTDYGDTWTSVVGSLPNSVMCMTSSGNNIFVCLENGGFMYNVFVSPDAGTTWLNISPPYDSVQTFSAQSIYADVFSLFVGTVGTNGGGAGLFGSTDNGSTWFTTPGSKYGDTAGLAPAFNNVYAVTSVGGRVFAGTEHGIYATMSEPFGGNFTYLSNGLTVPEVSALSSMGSNILCGTTGGVFVSTDNGGTWKNTLPDFPVLSFAHTGISFLGQALITGVEDSGAFISNDLGLTWYPANAGLNDTALLAGGYALAISGNYAFLGAVGGGLWRASAYTLGVKSASSASALQLMQNYPNPATHSGTTIAYSLPKESHVTLKVYNVLGQEVAMAVNQLEPVGSHEVNLNTAHLAPGAYLYRLEASELAAERVMVVAR